MTFFVVSPEESHRDQDIYFSRDQDHCLVRAVQAYGAGHWDHIRRGNPTLANISKPLLIKRWEMLNLDLDEDEELAMKTDADGNSVIGISNLGELMEMETGSVASENEDHCHICGLLGELLCCDSCPKVYHLKCLGLDAMPETEIWNCPECLDKAKDIVDDTELKDDDWQQYTETFGMIGSALQLAASGKGAVVAAGEDGTITQALIGVVQAPDSNFDRITAEIENKKGFQSQSLMEAENKLLADFAEKENLTVQEAEAKGEYDIAAAQEDDVDMEDDEEEDEEEYDDDDMIDLIDDDDVEDVVDDDTYAGVGSSAEQSLVNLLQPKRKPTIGTSRDEASASSAAVNILQPRRKKPA
mmetsp:Transcript_6433/g.8437  ORF Transcript_6433/g.8437 Transcript_6433/m.8437 type:complete len:357 (-) Transcript_6433:380-1450(-)